MATVTADNLPPLTGGQHGLLVLIFRSNRCK